MTCKPSSSRNALSISTIAISSSITRISVMAAGSYTLLVKDELARPAVIAKDPFTLGTASPQALLTQ
jgi:hypothetical protein